MYIHFVKRKKKLVPLIVSNIEQVLKLCIFIYLLNIPFSYIYVVDTYIVLYFKSITKKKKKTEEKYECNNDYT